MSIVAVASSICFYWHCF